jgi:nucleoside-diphosphate-sugar epimerase
MVTGAAGFIGSHTAHALLDAGWSVVGVDAFTDFYAIEEKRTNVASLVDRPGFRLVEADLVDLDMSPLLADVNAVVHLAAQAGVTGSWGNAFASYVDNNVRATQRVLEAVVRAQIPRLVVASSSSVYGNAPAYPCGEEIPARPVSPYGVTKLATEELCLAYGRANVGRFALALLRLFTVYGPRQRPDMAVRRFIEGALTGQPISIYGDGEQTRDFTYVGDAVRAIQLALEAPLAAEVLNIGGGDRTTVNQTLDLIARQTGRSLHVVRLPSRTGEVRHTGADCRRAERLLGWRPRVDLATGLAAQVGWCVQRPPTRAAGLGPTAGGRQPTSPPKADLLRRYTVSQAAAESSDPDFASGSGSMPVS